MLVVGAAATGIQLADEIQRSGRQVTLAVGGHVRAPRVYRGMDIQWWMDVTGLNDEMYTDVDDVMRVRRLPSFQLAGTRDRRTIDLNALTDIGVQPRRQVRRSQRRGQGTVLGLAAQPMRPRRPEARSASRHDRRVGERERGRSRDRSAASFRADPVEDDPPLMLDLTKGRFQTIIWATGFRPDYSWLDIPVVDAKGYIRHDGGVVDEAPGMYVMGMPFLRRRKSTLIDGAADDANDLGDHLATYLDGDSLKRGNPPLAGSRDAGGDDGQVGRWPITSSSGAGGRGGTECAPVVPAASNSSIARSAVSTHPPPLTVRSSKIAAARDPAAHASARGRSNPLERETRQPRAAPSRGRPRSGRTSAPTRSRTPRCRTAR